ncbi:MAG: glycosyltransferase [Ignavibacteriae bacterium]|nr:glycosyltransferase [Ignavibacteriota bacterium]
MENLILIIFAVIIIIGIGYQILSLIILKNIYSQKNRNNIIERKDYPLISILKPIKGIDDQLENNLISFYNLDYPNYEIIFGLHTKDDPALQIIKKISAEFSKIKTKIVIDNYMIGLNPKINNLYNMYPKSKGSFILISDSNTRVEPNFLKSLLSEFNDKNVGLVTASIRGIGAKNIPSIFENIHLNSFLLPSVFTASKIAKISIVIGKSILIPKNILTQIGGFEAFRNYLAEDYLMGVKVEELGYKVKTSSTFVDNINENLTLQKFLNRHSRWAKMRAKIRLNTYLLEAFSNPIAASFILAIILSNQIGLLQFITVSILKIILDFTSIKIIKSDLKFYHLLFIPIKDLIIGLVWYIPFINSEVNWRNNIFKIKKDSLLQPV